MYTKNNNIDELSILSRTKGDFAIRENFKYVSAENKIIEGSYDYIIIQKNRKFSNERILFLKKNNYLKIQNEFYDIYLYLKDYYGLIDFYKLLGNGGYRKLPHIYNFTYGNSKWKNFIFQVCELKFITNFKYECVIESNFFYSAISS